MKTYSVWYGEYVANSAWEACLLAAEGDEIEAMSLNTMFIERV